MNSNAEPKRISIKKMYTEKNKQNHTHNIDETNQFNEHESNP